MPTDALALSAERWAAIKAHRVEQQKEDDYRPKTGDTCYTIDDDVAWLTPAGRDYWEDKSNAECLRLSPSNSFPDKRFKYAVVAASGGTLLNLDIGTKVKVLDGKAATDGYGFEGYSGKVQILSGPKAGQICFCDGNYLKNTQVESNESFFKSQEERKAYQALFVSKQLNKPIEEMLAIHGVRINAPVAAEVKVPAKSSVVTHPAEPAETFGNGKYAFELQVPAGMFAPKRIEGDNSNSDDHFYLQSNDGDALIYAWGQPISKATTPEQALKREVLSNKQWVCTLKKFGDQFFVVSGYVNDQIFYQKTILKGNHTINFLITIDKAIRKKYDSTTEMLAQSLKATK
jgi:hypothetical protein